MVGVGGGEWGWGGKWWTSNFGCWVQTAKIPNSYTAGRGGGGVVNDKLPTFDAESKSAKIPNSLYGVVGAGVGGVGNELLVFDAESKYAKI